MPRTHERRRRGSGEGLRRSSSPNGCRSDARRSSRSRRRRGPAGRRRRRAASRAATALRAPRRRRRTRRGRDGRESARRERYGAAVIAAPPPPPAIEQPAPYEISYGLVAGIAAPGTRRDRRPRRRPDAGRACRCGGASSSCASTLPAAETSVRVIDGRRRRAPQQQRDGRARPRRSACGAAPGVRARGTTRCCGGEVRRLAGAFGGTSAIYVQNLTTGAGAAWNAQATFPARLDAQARDRGSRPRTRRRDTGRRARRSTGCCGEMLVYSDNAAANAHRALLRRLDVGRLGDRQRDDARRSGSSTPRCTAATSSTRSSRSAARGRDPAAGRQPAELGDRQADDRLRPRAACCARSGSRAADAARSATTQPGFTPADARYLLYLLAHVRDPGKIDRAVGRLPGVRVLHKAGWINARPPRQRHRPLAGRRARRDRDDLPPGRRRRLLGRARGERRRGSALRRYRG